MSYRGGGEVGGKTGGRGDIAGIGVTSKCDRLGMTRRRRAAKATRGGRMLAASCQCQCFVARHECREQEHSGGSGNYCDTRLLPLHTTMRTEGDAFFLLRNNGQHEMTSESECWLRM